eukprot:PITA_07762
MKLRFTRNEVDPKLCLKVVDDRPVIPTPSEDDLFLTSADPLICKNICFTVSMLSSYMVEPHWIDAKNFLRYLRGTISHGLRYTARNVKLPDYLNVHWAGSVEDRKSTSECWFSLGSATISWMNRKQKMVALNTVETEHIATSITSCEVAWLRKLLVSYLYT